jgi:tRNA (guanine-N7-)-methyltransferase
MITFELLSPGKYLPADYFLREAPGTERIEIEIGPGDGRFLFESARADRRTAFVGIELRKGWARRLLEDPRRPPNALVYHGDGGWLCRHLFAPDSIDAFHLYFPDPWWKKKHHKRRLVTPELAAALVRCLKHDGVVYVITDVAPLFTAISQSLVEAGLSREDWSRDTDAPAQSSYERKYRRQARRLYGARYTKA